MNSPTWTRRNLLKTGALAALAYPTRHLLGAERVALAGGTDAAMALQVPDWIGAGKLRWVWALWEPIDLYTRGGSGAGIGDSRATGHWVRRWYERMHSDEILDKLAAAGVNVVTTHFYKGFGLRAESAEMERAADFTRRAHARGIRVLGYHQFSTVIYETMLDEVPQLEKWIQRTSTGELRTYGSAKWRWLACPTHDDFIAYLKKVVDRCLIDADMDGVEYDGTSYDCACENCQSAFRQFLAARHPEPRARFGLPHLRNVRIPEATNAKDPLWQEWIRFRMDLMGRRLREMRAYIHARKRGAAMVTYEDCPALWRKDRTRLLPDTGDYLDLAIAENHDMPQTLNGELVTKVRHLKEASALGVVGLSTDWLRTEKGGITLPKEPGPVELDMAECLASGGHVCAATWALRAGDKRDGSALFEEPPFYAAMKRYLQFARSHEHLYTAAQPCANVWIYHSLWSLVFNHSTAYSSVLGFEQSLLGRVAYRVAKEAHLAGLTNRDVLIVANQACLSAQECEAIRGAVARGCGVILTGETAACDENFRQHELPELRDLHAKPNVRYLAKCPARGAKSDARGILSPVMPARAAEIIRVIRDLAPRGFAAELTGGAAKQPNLFVDVFQQPDAVVAHVVNYAEPAKEALKLRIADWLGAGAVTLYSPYLETPCKLEPAPDHWITLPAAMGRYGAVRYLRA